MSLSGTSVSAAILGTINKALNLPGSGATASLVYNKNVPLDDGVGDYMAQQIWSDRRTLAGNASESLILSSGGTLLDPLGQPIAMTKVVAMLVAPDPTNVGDLQLGGAVGQQFATWINPVTGYLILRPGTFICLCAPQGGYAVTLTTADKLQVKNAHATAAAIYDIMIIGS